MINKIPNITICVTTYNRKLLLPITIKSILQQTYRDFEIIIVDDYSTDGTKELVENEILPLDDRIKYIRHNENKGLSVGRNTAIFNAQGKYFTFVDDDDRWEKDFLEFFINASVNLDATYALCASSISNNSSIKAITAKMKDFLILGYTPPVASQFYMTETLKKVDGYDENIKSGVDHDLWLTLGKNNLNLLWLNRSLVVINQVQSSARMTYNIHKRINGIKSSLLVWKKRIGSTFGEQFFTCFEKNYKYNTYKKFLFFSLKNKEYLRTFISL